MPSQTSISLIYKDCISLQFSRKSAFLPEYEVEKAAALVKVPEEGVERLPGSIGVCEIAKDL